MRFFDANCCLGKLSVPLPGFFSTAKELDQERRRAGIDQALVYHATAKESGPTAGNRKLLEELEGFPDLHPCWCLLPHHTGEMPPGKELVAEMIEEGVWAARIFPRTHNWSLSEWCSRDLLAALEEAALPLFIDLHETSCDEVAALCERHPGLPVVLTAAPFRLSRLVYALLATRPNLYLETSSFQLHGGIEDVCKRFGPGRLVFGTDAPRFQTIQGHPPELEPHQALFILEPAHGLAAGGL